MYFAVTAGVLRGLQQAQASSPSAVDIVCGIGSAVPCRIFAPSLSDACRHQQAKQPSPLGMWWSIFVSAHRMPTKTSLLHFRSTFNAGFFTTKTCDKLLRAQTIDQQHQTSLLRAGRLACTTFSLKGKRFEAPRDLRSRKVAVRFDRRSFGRAVVFYKGERMGEAKLVDFEANDRPAKRAEVDA